LITSVKLFIFVYIATIVIKGTGLNNLFKKTNPGIARLVDIAANAVGTANLDLDPPPINNKKMDDIIIPDDPHEDIFLEDRILNDETDVMLPENDGISLNNVIKNPNVE